MSEADSSQCQVCGKPAMVHVCSIINGVSSSAHYCERCAPEDMQRSRWARCEYCGDKATSGGTNPFSIKEEEPRQIWLCRLCFEERSRFFMEGIREPGLRQMAPEAQWAALRKLRVALEEHMRQWIAEKEARRISELNQARDPMNASSPREVITQWFERVWQQRSKEAVTELMAEDGVAHQPSGGGIVKGHAEFLAFQEHLLSGLPNFSLKILHALGDDRQACLHWEATGTHGGNLLGLAPTQKKVTFSGLSFVHVVDGKITEGWDCWDIGSLKAELAGQ